MAVVAGCWHMSHVIDVETCSGPEELMTCKLALEFGHEKVLDLRAPTAGSV